MLAVSGLRPNGGAGVRAHGQKRHVSLFPAGSNTLLNLADIHVLPQRADAADLVMPSKLTGMLASGKAVIATAHPETELGSVVQEVGVLVPPEDPRALANAIQTLKENAARRTSLGVRGRRYAEIHFDRQHVLENIHEYLIALGGE